MDMNCIKGCMFAPLDFEYLTDVWNPLVSSIYSAIKHFANKPSWRRRSEGFFLNYFSYFSVG